MKHKATEFKTTKVKGGSLYVEVKDRVKYLAFEFEGDYSITTDYQYFENQRMWVVKATLTLIQGETQSVYTGLAQEIESDKLGAVNSTSALENAETSAVGRACAFAGIGIETSIASADEVNKAISRTDAQQASANTNTSPAPQRAKQHPVMSKQQADDKLNGVNKTIEEGERPITIKQKTDILLLLNNSVITKEEKERMVSKITTFDTERADQAIAKLKKVIKERSETDPYEVKPESL